MPSKFVRDEQRDEVIAREGTTVTLTCNATGIPTPNITWFRRLSKEEEHPERKRNLYLFCFSFYILNIT